MKSTEPELAHDGLTGPMETFPWDHETTGEGGIMVYSRSQGWTEFNDTDEEDRTGWPFFGDKRGELQINRIMWDDPTQTIVVIVD